MGVMLYCAYGIVEDSKSFRHSAFLTPRTIFIRYLKASDEQICGKLEARRSHLSRKKARYHNSSAYYTMDAVVSYQRG